MQPKLLQKGKHICSQWTCQSAQFSNFLKPPTSELDLLTFLPTAEITPKDASFKVWSYFCFLQQSVLEGHTRSPCLCRGAPHAADVHIKQEESNSYFLSHVSDVTYEESV